MSAMARVTGWVSEKIAQNVAQPMFCHNFYRGKKLPQNIVLLPKFFW
jgi:hypothetical protein